MTSRAALIVAGPTASGKSRLALSLAKAFDGTIINADALQIYRDLEILTARPSPAEMRRVPHRLYGELAADQRCGAGRWRELAIEAIEATHHAGRLPILVGGTGMYLRALLHGLSPIPPVPAEYRDAAMAKMVELGPDAFHSALAERDPQTAARLAPGDRQRLTRAWEILEYTGRSQADWLEDDGGDPPRGLRFLTFLLQPPRDLLYADCDSRYLAMIENGALDEVRALMDLSPPPDSAVMKAVGVPPLRRHLQGEIPLEEAISLGQRDTRRYAKRQMTWFRNQLLPDWAIDSKYMESMEEEIFSFVSNFLLTPKP